MTAKKTETAKASKAAAAQHLFMSPRTLRRLQEEKKLPASGTLDEYRERHIFNLRAAAAGRSAQHGDLDLVEQRALLAQKQRERLTLEIAIKRNEYVLVDVATRQVDQLAQVLREHLLSIGARCCADLAGLVDLPPGRAAAITDAMKTTVDKYVHEAMSSFQDMNQSGKLAELLAPENPPEEATK